jgi:hypothetical protein
MKTITLNVPNELASQLEQLTEQKKQSALETLSMLLNDKRTLFEVMDDISEYAKKQGMTEEMLNDLLKEK